MRLQYEAKITMYKSIEQHLDTAPAVVGSVAALQHAVGQYKALLAGIDDAASIMVTVASGVSANKAAAKAKLAEAAADLSAPARAFAADTGNNALADGTGRGIYRFTRLRDEGLPPVCRAILENVREHRTALTEYGVTDEKVAALESALSAYQSNVVAPRAAVGSRRTQTERIIGLMRQSDELLKNRIDNLVENFRQTHPEFYGTYFRLRVVSSRGNRITQIRGTVTDAATGEAIKNATITIGGKTAKTDSSGEYAIRPIPPGKQLLKIEADGYQTFENDETQIAPGEIKRTISTLNPAN